jgi:hypothetical protein
VGEKSMKNGDFTGLWLKDPSLVTNTAPFVFASPATELLYTTIVRYNAQDYVNGLGASANEKPPWRTRMLPVHQQSRLFNWNRPV